MDIKKAIKKTVLSENLTRTESFEVFDQIMSGEAAPSQIAAFITALRMKKETIEEVTGAAEVMRNKAVKIDCGGSSPNSDMPEKVILDTCGTGGSGKNTFNISTTCAFVLAGTGVKVAKHGNRAASSRCGSADVLEGLGVNINVPPEVAGKCIREINVGFFFAPVFHSAMKYAGGVRKEIGIRTIFNILGPLANPACADHQVLGVYDPDLLKLMASALRNLGSKKAYVVHGDDGLDEVTISSTTSVCEVFGSEIRSYKIAPEDFGIRRASLSEIKGGTAEENAKIVRKVLSGEKGPRRDVVLMNSALALMTVGKHSSFKDAVGVASAVIDSGKAFKKLEELIEITNR